MNPRRFDSSTVSIGSCQHCCGLDLAALCDKKSTWSTSQRSAAAAAAAVSHAETDLRWQPEELVTDGYSSLIDTGWLTSSTFPRQRPATWQH